MFKPTLTVLSPEAFVPQVAKSFSWSPETVKKAHAEVEKHARYAGAVVKVNDHLVEHRMSDYSMYSAAQTVTVWDAEAGTGLTFDALVLSEGETKGSTLWSEDATDEARAAYKKWYMEVSAPAQAADKAESARKHTELSYAKAMDAVLNPKMQHGQSWKVVRGRKVPIGTVGTVFWMGNTKWGMSCGIATTNRKNEKGHFADGFFLNPDNLEYIPTEDDKRKVDELRAEMWEAVEASARATYGRTLEAARNSCPVA